jgi:hypothetical protein
MISNICYSIFFMALNFFLLKKVILNKTLESKNYIIIGICFIISLLGIKYLFNDSFFIPKKNFIFLYFFSLVPILLKMFNNLDNRFLLKLNNVFDLNIDSNNYVNFQAIIFSFLLTIFQFILIWNPEILNKI